LIEFLLSRTKSMRVSLLWA